MSTKYNNCGLYRFLHHQKLEISSMKLLNSKVDRVFNFKGGPSIKVSAVLASRGRGTIRDSSTLKSSIKIGRRWKEGILWWRKSQGKDHLLSNNSKLLRESIKKIKRNHSVFHCNKLNRLIRICAGLA